MLLNINKKIKPFMKPSLKKLVNEEDGFTVQELLIALTAGLSLLGVAAVIYATILWPRIMISRESNSLLSIRDGISNLYEGQTDYTDISNEIVRGAQGIIPTWMIGASSEGHIMHTWNNADDAVQIQDDGDGRFRIVYNAMPEDSCVMLTAKMIGKFQRVEIEGTAVNTVLEVNDNCAEDAAIAFYWR